MTISLLESLVGPNHRDTTGARLQSADQVLHELS